MALSEGKKNKSKNKKPSAMIVNNRMKERLKSDFNEQVVARQQKEEVVVECFWYFVSLKDEMAAGCVFVCGHGRSFARVMTYLLMLAFVFAPAA